MRKNRKALLTGLNVLIYVAAAVVVFGWLAIRASNGGLFTSAHATYLTTVPSAPGIEVNKTNVISMSGVRVGVVTKVDRVGNGEGTQLELKLTKADLDLREDASSTVVIQNIIGERAVMLNPGKAKERAEDGAKLKFAESDAVIEPSNALTPVEDLLGVRDDPELKSFLQQQEEVLGGADEDLQSVLDNGKVLADTLGAEQVALSAIGGRTGELLDVLSAEGPTLEQVLAQTDALAKDAEGLLDDNLVVLQNGLELGADTLAMISRRSSEIELVLDKLPVFVDDLEIMSEVTIKMLHNVKGYNVLFGATNVPDLEKVVEILKQGPNA